MVSGGTRVSELISESEMASDAAPVDGRLCSTATAAKSRRTEKSAPNELGKAAGEDGWEGTVNQKSKGQGGGTVP